MRFCLLSNSILSFNSIIQFESISSKNCEIRSTVSFGLLKCTQCPPPSTIMAFSFLVFRSYDSFEPVFGNFAWNKTAKNGLKTAVIQQHLKTCWGSGFWGFTFYIKYIFIHRALISILLQLILQLSTKKIKIHVNVPEFKKYYHLFTLLTYIIICG